MNPIQIEQKIAEDLKTIRTSEDLKKLQKWVRHAKKNPVHEPSLECINKYYYWQKHRRYTGAHYYTNEVKVESIQFQFLGIEILIERDNNDKYKIPENQFDTKRIWENSMKSYIGTSYYPKEKIDEMFMKRPYKPLTKEDWDDEFPVCNCERCNHSLRLPFRYEHFS